jgi:hypothetical protein
LASADDRADKLRRHRWIRRHRGVTLLAIEELLPAQTGWR